MAFSPKGSNRSNGNTTFKRDPNVKFPVPKAGNRPARVSLIVDLGNQNRKDFEDPKTKEVKPQKPADQIAIFLDLTADVVDYGSVIGKQPYRLMLNKSFNGELDGINFGVGPVRDANGNIMKDKPYNYHPMSLITKLAKATKTEEIISGKNLDIEQLLNKGLMATVEIKETEDKNGRIDETTNKVRKYTNVNFRGVSEVPVMPDDSLFPVPALQLPPMVITFENATADVIKYIRRDVINKIKMANNYQGSNMQKAIAEYEAQFEKESPTKEEQKEETPFDDSFDDDVPF